MRHRPIRRVTLTVPPARILGLQDCLFLGNFNSLRDWGHARDYVEMQWLMLQQSQPEDYVIATGEQHSVREFVELAFHCIGRRIDWRAKKPSRSRPCEV